MSRHRPRPRYFGIGEELRYTLPPRGRRWMVTRSDNMGLGNVSLAAAIRFAIVELFRGYGWSKIDRIARPR